MTTAEAATQLGLSETPSGPKYSTPYAMCMYVKDSMSGTPTSIDDYQIDEVGSQKNRYALWTTSLTFVVVILLKLF